MEQTSQNMNINVRKKTSQTRAAGKLFVQWTRINPRISTKIEMELAQYNQANYFLRSSINGSVEKLSQTPPLLKKSALTPTAPIKKKKQCNNSELKPKKLTYRDEGPYEIDDGDSGVILDFGCSLSNNGNSEKCNAMKRNIFNCSRGAENVPNIKEVTQNSNEMNELRITRPKTKLLQLNNKANENNVPKMQEIVGARKNKKNSIIKTAVCTKKSIICSKNNQNLYESKESEINNYHTKEKKSNHGVFMLSQYNGSETWQDKLQWLQPRRDIGMWIQCCHKNCQKWRYTEDYHDPVNVPTNWYCEMNSDTKIASCAIPEIPKLEEIEVDLIENKYNAGSIVWAKKNTYTWWPAMVDDCPFTLAYYKLKKNSIIPVMYHVIFFDEKEIRHSWRKCENIEPFNTDRSNIFLEKANRNNIYANRLRRSYHLAFTATFMTILERLRRYSFLALYKPEIQLNNNENNNIILTTVHENATETISHNSNKRSSTVFLTNLIDNNEIIPSSQPELDTTIRLKKKKKI